MGPNRLRDESEPNTSRSAAPPSDARADTSGAERSTASTRRRPATVGYALIGAAVTAYRWFVRLWVVGVLVVSIILAVAVGIGTGSLPLAALTLAACIGGGLGPVAFVPVAARKPRTQVPATGYEHLSDEGREATSGALSVVVLFLVVLAWAVPATIVALGIALVSLQLPLSDTAKSIAGLAVVVGFLGILVAGPIWTLHTIRRRRIDQRTDAVAAGLGAPPWTNSETRALDGQGGTSRTTKLLWGGVLVVAILMFGALVAIPDFAVNSMDRASVGPAAAPIGSSVAGSW